MENSTNQLSNIEIQGAAIEVTDDGIYIYDDRTIEIVSWIKDEWVSEPDIVPSIVNAVFIRLTQGSKALKDKLDVEAENEEFETKRREPDWGVDRDTEDYSDPTVMHQTFEDDISDWHD